MMVSDYLGMKLSDILSEDEDCSEVESLNDSSGDMVIKVEKQWFSSIESLEKLLATTLEKDQNNCPSLQGIIFSSSTPIIRDLKLLSHLETVIFSSGNYPSMALMPSPHQTSFEKISSSSFININLPINDSLNHEQFGLVVTEKFSCAIVKSIQDKTQAKFNFSFNPEVIKKIWFLLKLRLKNSQSYYTEYLDNLFNKFSPQNPHYKIVSNFTRYLLESLYLEETLNKKPQENNKIPRQSNSISLKKTPLPPYPEFELLQALTHEIRTPLTTIKTLTKLLLKRAKNTPELVKYIESIEQECTEQINRMELIFRAAELESKSPDKSEVKLVPISLEQILNQSIPHWKKQAERRNIILDIIIPQKLPQIVSDPNMLSQILTGLMEKFTRNLPNGGNFKVLILPAGNQLKLQFLSEANTNNNQVKCLGKLLLFQPDTGSLSLSYDVTKNIFQALGGKFIMKQKPHKGEILTVFLPLGKTTI